MEIQNIFLFLFIIFFMAIWFVVGIYFMVYYSHRREKSFAGQNLIQGLVVFGFAFPILILMLPAIDFLFNKSNHVTSDMGLESLDHIYTTSNFVPWVLILSVILFLTNAFAIDFYRCDKIILKTKILVSLKRPVTYFFFYMVAVVVFYILGQASPSMKSVVNDTYVSSDSSEIITKDQFFKSDIKLRIKLQFIDAMLIPLIFLGSFYFVSYVGAMTAFYP